MAATPQSGRFDPRRCAVLVPYHASIEAECEAGLRELERRGYAVRRVGGNAQIDVARNQMATDALADGFEETLWIDADIMFDPDAVDRLRAHPHGIVGGLYARKGSPGFACSLLPGTRSIAFGERGGLVEVLYLGTGFLLVRREVYLAVQERFKLPVCNEQFGKALVPFFQPLVREVGGVSRGGGGEPTGGGGDLRSGGGGSVGDRPQHAGGERPKHAGVERPQHGATPFVKTQGVPPAVGINPTARDALATGDGLTARDAHAQRGGHWYLGEDYAFCHRARESGYRIYADTTIRLWHIGRQHYTWEDAAGKREQVASFDFTIADSKEAPRGGGDPERVLEFNSHEDEVANGELNGALAPAPVGINPTARSALAARNAVAARAGRADRQVVTFAERYPWPAEKPVVPAFPERNWLFRATQGLLRHSVPQTAKLIVELGSWTGRSTRFLADFAPGAMVVAIDHWRGSPEHFEDPELREVLPRLYETFLCECWEYRERVIPVRAGSVEGLRAVAEAGLTPDAIYVDADHRYESVVADLTAALDLFPQAIIVGDDWNWEGVGRGVEAVLKPRGLRCEVLETAWRVVK